MRSTDQSRLPVSRCLLVALERLDHTQIRMRSRAHVAAAGQLPHATAAGARRFAEQGAARNAGRARACRCRGAPCDQQRVRPARPPRERSRGRIALPGATRTAMPVPCRRSQRLDDRLDQLLAPPRAAGAVDDATARPDPTARAEIDTCGRARRIRPPRARTSSPPPRSPRRSRPTSGRHVEQQRQVGLQVGEHASRSSAAMRSCGDAVASALVGVGRVGEAIAHDPVARGQRAAGSHARSARAARRTSAASRCQLRHRLVQQQLAQPLAERRAARLARQPRRVRPARSSAALSHAADACSCPRRRCLRR